MQAEAATTRTKRVLQTEYGEPTAGAWLVEQLKLEAPERLFIGCQSMDSESISLATIMGGLLNSAGWSASNTPAHLFPMNTIIGVQLVAPKETLAIRVFGNWLGLVGLQPTCYLVPTRDSSTLTIGVNPQAH